MAAGNQVPSVKLTSESVGHGGARRGGTGAQRAHRRATSTAITGIVVGTPHRPRRQLRQRRGDLDLTPDPLDGEITLDVTPTVVAAPGATARSRSGSRRPAPTGTGRRRSTRSSSCEFVGRDRHRARRHLRATSSGAALARARRRRRGRCAADRDDRVVRRCWHPGSTTPPRTPSTMIESPCRSESTNWRWRPRKRRNSHSVSRPTSG